MDNLAKKELDPKVDPKRDQATALARIVDEVRADAHQAPTEYLENSEVPEGGE